MAVLLLDDGGRLLLPGIVDSNSHALPGLLLQTGATGGPLYDDPFEPARYRYNEKHRADIRYWPE